MTLAVNLGLHRFESVEVQTSLQLFSDVAQLSEPRLARLGVQRIILVEPAGFVDEIGLSARGDSYFRTDAQMVIQIREWNSLG